MKRSNDVLKGVRTVEQGVFEEEVMRRVEKEYDDHVREERESLREEERMLEERKRLISESVDHLSQCLQSHLRSSTRSYEDFQKITNSLKNQINAKKQEFEKLLRLGVRLTDRLKSLELADKFTSILDEAGRRKTSVDVVSSQETRDVTESKESTQLNETEANESDDSADSDQTMIFECQKEELEYNDPVIKKRKVETEPAQHNMRMKVPSMKGEKITDDADNEEFYERIISYQNEVMAKQQDKDKDGVEAADDDIEDDEEIESAFFVPKKVWNRLYQFQRIGVRWLLELHNGKVGGILGDEMGLGKTVQIIAFLAGLHKSRGVNYECGPILIVCPATVLRQWLVEFRIWAPLFRVAVLHSTGNGYDRPKKLITTIVKEPGVLLTTYTSMVLHHSLLIDHTWHYVILDEGHKIKNPNAKMTVCIKKFHTPHRLILSGSPIQNNLKELWSLVDFVYPGKLGSLASFMQNFAVPIMKGGYDNASPLQVEAAYRCACVIRDTINAYLIRRSKTEVQLQLPKKSEQVLFCGLSEHQIVVYKEYLRSKQCKQVLTGKEVPFPALVTLRKICNHTDLVTGGPSYVMDHPVLGFGRDAGEDGRAHKYGHYTRSGKMLVMKELLELWYRGKHKVLLFTQGRMMLQILRRYIEERQYPYCVMDGTTAIGSRHNIVEKFNCAPYNEAFIFLLTTRVGGIGLNLTGADRVLVFDPDWNPCTDMQARERSWRIGQSKEVTIYRLVTTGTIEEKIYHRQVFKQFLTNRILKNPRQRRFFKTQDLQDLFRFDDKTVQSDTSIMFNGDKNYKSLKTNYFDDNPSIKNIVIEDDDDDKEGRRGEIMKDVVVEDKEGRRGETVNEVIVEYKEDDVKMNKEENSVEEVRKLSEEELLRLRDQARRLSKAISNIQESKRTKVEGASIKNVRYRREYQSEDLATTATNSAAEHLVSVLVPRVSAERPALSYRESRVAEQVAEKAKRSLEHTLAEAGVTDCLRHDAVVADDTCDWSLENSLTEKSAKAAVSWLRSHLVSRNKDYRTLGCVKNHYLWKKQEETCYLQSIDCTRSEHFQGTSLGELTSSKTHVRYSSSIMLAIISNRTPSSSSSSSSFRKKGLYNDVVISPDIKSMVKSLYIFLSHPSRLRRPVSSSDIITYFKDSVSPSKNLLFKSLLSELCSFHKSSSNKGLWRLKSHLLAK